MVFKKINFLRKPIWIIATLLVATSSAFAQETAHVAADPLLDLSLEQLMDVEVTSMMKTTTRLSETPGAIFVLTNDDIRRTGATSIPEALRVVPGLNVSRIDTNEWAITARGFNSQFANKLLVLVDGRSVYTPQYSSVCWDQQDVMMEDIDRIEVIRGPGASLWGANAVNGVINIITKSAKNTQGGLVSVHAGDERGGAGLRYGAKIGDDAFIKLYGRTAMHSGESEPGSNANAGDISRLNKAGFRFEKEITANNKLTFQGDVFTGESGSAKSWFPNLTASLTPTLTPHYSILLRPTQTYKGYNLESRWEQRQSDYSNTSLQLYWNNQERTSSNVNTTITTDTLDVDFQHNLKVSSRQNWVWGLGYRRNMLDTSAGFILSATNKQHKDDILSVFMQDDITFVPQKWKLTLGSRIEHNPDTGYEVEPNARLLWTPNEYQSVWASVSHAVRTPNWVQHNSIYSLQIIPPTSLMPLPMMVGVLGSTNSVSEKLIAYELGWRGVIRPSLTADISLYYYNYKDIQSTTPNPIDFSHIGSGYLLQTISFSNYGKAQTYGGELSLDWQVMDNWKLRVSYS